MMKFDLKMVESYRRVKASYFFERVMLSLQLVEKQFDFHVTVKESSVVAIFERQAMVAVAHPWKLVRMEMNTLLAPVHQQYYYDLVKQVRLDCYPLQHWWRRDSSMLGMIRAAYFLAEYWQEME